EFAQRYGQANLAIIPVRRDGTKAPSVESWDRYKDQLPTDEELLTWFGGPKPFGPAIVRGKVSGNAELIDIDAGSLFSDWCDLVEEECPGLTGRLSINTTPREPRGYHVSYRCPEIDIPGNQKLAQRPDIDANTGKPTRQTLIETRGEGGYALAPGCPPE